jgi:zinc protease
MTTMLNAEATAQTFDLTEGVARTRLDNGLTVLTKEVHGKPLVSSMIWYCVGSRNEELGQTGKSHFLEHMLFKGTDRYRKGEIDLLTLQHGGANNAFTDTDFTAYYFNFAADRWEVALEIEANRMTHNAFVLEEYESEKEVVEEELRIGLDSPWGALDQAVWAAAYHQHPYHNPVIGWLEDLERATRDEMEAYYQQWYHPRNAALVIVGDINTEQTLRRVEELFGAIPAGPGPKLMSIREQSQRGERRLIVKKQTGVERLQIAWHAPEVAHADSYPLQVLSTLLSTGKTSRLYQRLEERDQSVTHQSVEYSDRIDPTLFVIRAEIKPSHQTAEVERAIYEEVDRLGQSPVSSEELERAKQLIKARFVLGHEQVSNQAIALGYYETINCYDYLADFFARISEVTVADVERAAQKYLLEDGRTVGYLLNDGAKQ